MTGGVSRALHEREREREMRVEAERMVRSRSVLSTLRRRRSMPSLMLSASPRVKQAGCERWEALLLSSPRRKRVDDDTVTTAAAVNAHVVARDELRCPICFDMLCYPVTLPCGHNFDRGCLLTAWEHDAGTSTHGAVQEHAAVAHSCPICRQSMHLVDPSQVHVNLLLQTLIAAQYPVEMQGLTTPDKCRAMVPSHGPASPSNRRRHSWRTATSFFYVWLASVTDPPGFVLAVLLLMSLVAIALTPQQMLANPATLPTAFESMDSILNGLVLLIREISLSWDHLDDLWSCIQVFAVVM